ncbi:MAG: riboflavin synthase [Chlorobiaceae bacterium]|nr:riboflavin synthase [Chlorobiaceae bacterium]
MFTGIVKDVGTVSVVTPRGTGLRLRVDYASAAAFGDLSIDESVSVNGACQTVVACGAGWFEVDSVPETLKKTTLGSFRPGTRVNLERAVRPMDRLGGHFVLGHVDCVGRISKVTETGEGRMVSISYPPGFDAWIVPVGSIAIDGVSLTVANVVPSLLTVALIPYTLGNTTIAALREGSEVNLEFDILGKYVARQQQTAGAAGKNSRISESWLTEQGFS